jgi:hypothetical protein
MIPDAVLNHKQVWYQIIPTARHITRLSLESPVSALILVIVRVVNHTGINFHSVPIKYAVTLGTPHLGTTGSLEYHLTALGTGLGILG